MQGMAERGRKTPVANLIDDADRAECLLREAIAILDAGDFDRAAAYADMARQALTEATQLRNSR
jgi:cellobiose-specific phosphotransferase system component IIA